MDEKILIQRLLDVLNDWDLNCSEEPELKLEIARQQATVVKLLATPVVSKRLILENLLERMQSVYPEYYLSIIQDELDGLNGC
jgi:hypothetical protein